MAPLASRRHCHAAAAAATLLGALLLQGCGGRSPSPSPSPAPTPPPTAPPPAPTVPTQRLRNGVEMPVVSAGVWQYTPEQAEQAVEEALTAGFTHIDTAFDYGNQDGVAKGLKKAMSGGRSRGSIFVTTKVPGCGAENVSSKSNESCYSDTKARIEDDLRLLELSKIDLVLVHCPPCSTMNTTECFVKKSGCSEQSSCSMIQAQWKAMSEAYNEGKLRAVGVSNYCSGCFKCLEGFDVQPMVNQVHYQIGMGPDPQGFKSLAEKDGVVLQAWSPLGMGGKGSSDIMHGNMTTSIGKKHGKSAVQVALRWIVANGVSVSTKSLNPEHLRENLALFDFELDKQDMLELDKARLEEAGEPSFLCRDPDPSAVAQVVV